MFPMLTRDGVLFGRWRSFPSLTWTSSVFRSWVLMAERVMTFFKCMHTVAHTHAHMLCVCVCVCLCAACTFCTPGSVSVLLRRDQSTCSFYLFICRCQEKRQTACLKGFVSPSGNQVKIYNLNAALNDVCVCVRACV